MFNPIKMIVDVEHALEAASFAAGGVVTFAAYTVFDQPQMTLDTLPVVYRTGKDGYYKHVVQHNIVVRNIYPFQLWMFNDAQKAVRGVLDALIAEYEREGVKLPENLAIANAGIQVDLTPGLVLRGFGLVLTSLGYLIDGKEDDELDKAWEDVLDVLIKASEDAGNEITK